MHHPSCTYSYTYCRSILATSAWCNFHPFCCEASYRHWSTWEPENQRWKKKKLFIWCWISNSSSPKSILQKEEQSKSTSRNHQWQAESSDKNNPVDISTLPLDNANSIDEFIWNVNKRGKGNLHSPRHQVLMLNSRILTPLVCFQIICYKRNSIRHCKI